MQGVEIRSHMIDTLILEMFGAKSVAKLSAVLASSYPGRLINRPSNSLRD